MNFVAATDSGPRPGSLRHALTTFVGRQPQKAAIATALQTARLVTVHGPAGYGKTRVALECLKDLGDNYDQVAGVDLAVLTRVDLLPRFVGAQLDPPIARMSAAPGLDDLIDHLRDLDPKEKVLIVLDNCEHYVDEVATLCTDVLSAVTSVQILATSQVPLSIDGEVQIRIGQLTMPPAGTADAVTDDGIDPTGAAYGEATELLVRRVRSRSDAADFAIAPHNLAGVLKLLDAIDGNALAVEMAAQWIPELTPAALADKLYLLGRDDLAAGRRYDSLDAMVRATWELCSEGEKLVWTLLWVLVGEFDIDAATAIIGDALHSPDRPEPADRDAEILLIIRGLLRKGVLTGNTSRLRMRETLRREGRKRAEAAGLVDRIRERHARYYHDGVAATSELYFTDKEMVGMRWFGNHLPNIQAALAACCEIEGLEAVGLDIATMMASYLAWWFHGSINEGKNWLERTLELNPEPSPGRVFGLALQGFYETCQGGHRSATELLDQARAVVARCDPDSGSTKVAAATVAGIVGAQRWLTGHADSVDLLESAADDLAALGVYGRSYFVLNLAAFSGASYSTDSRRMLRLGDALIVKCQAVGWPGWNGPWALFTAGLNYLEHGGPADLGRAIELIRSALSQQFAVGDQWGPGIIPGFLAVALARNHMFTLAALVLRAAVVLAKRAGLQLDALVPLTAGVLQARALIAAAPDAHTYDTTSPMSRAEAEATLTELVSSPILGDTATPAASAGAVLSDRELEVVRLIATGMTYKGIGAELFITTRTVESHAARAMRRVSQATGRPITNRHDLGDWFREQQSQDDLA